jgi:hypothetical protein
MKLGTFALLTRTLALGALLIVSPLSAAADPSAGKTTAKDVGRKVDETGRAIKNYTVEQRDEAVKKAKAALDDADRRISRLERKVDDEWDRTDEAAHRKARATLHALRRERDEAAEWFGGLKHSSKESRDQVRDGFVKSYETLKESFAKARKEF